MSEREHEWDEAEEVGPSRVMQGLEVLSRSFRAEEVGLYPTHKVELFKAFLSRTWLRCLLQEHSSGRSVRRVGDQGRERRKVSKFWCWVSQPIKDLVS